MKYAVAILLIAVLCIGTNSCQKDFQISDVDSSSIPGGPGNTVTGSFTAVINGVAFKADKAATATKALDIIAIAGLDNNGQQIVLRVADSGVHVYSLDIGSSTNVGAYNKNSDVAFTTNGGADASQSGGTLSITAIDTVNKTLTGTFTLLGYRPIDNMQVNITQGIFKNISYSTQPINQASSTDTFRVKVDGVQFPTYAIGGILAFGTINVSASNQDVSKSVGLSLTSSTVPGTYDLSSFNFDYIGQYNTGGSYLLASSGSIIVLENNASTKRIRGSFNFVADELTGSASASLTEGYFSLVYQ